MEGNFKSQQEIAADCKIAEILSQYIIKSKTMNNIGSIYQTRCVVNATNAPALCQSFKAMFNLFQFQGG
jgi:hypothetical protein